MPLTKTTIRGYAASIAFVAAGATLAGAAVFHLPVLGFGGAPSASAAPVHVHAVAHPVKVAPIKVFRTRVVTDIVHRPAPSIAAPVRTVATAYAPPVASVPPVAYTATAHAPPTAYQDGAERDHEGGGHAPPGARASRPSGAEGGDQ